MKVAILLTIIIVGGWMLWHSYAYLLPRKYISIAFYVPLAVAFIVGYICIKKEK